MKRSLMALTLMLGACAITPDNPAANVEASEPLLCADRGQCDIYWQRAQAWIGSNSFYKIQTVSDAIIQTFGPRPSGVDLAYTITRVPNRDGSGRIYVNPNCGNLIGCTPTRTEAVIAFKRFVRA
jgi:hypothetical protein